MPTPFFLYSNEILYIGDTFKYNTMMKKIIICLLILFSAVSGNAQRHTFMNMDKASRIFYDSVMYIKPQFYPGVVISIDGKQSSGSVNICTINQGLYFISPENDTLLVSNQETIDRVYILGRTYVNSKYGFVEMLEAAADVTLCELRLTEIHTDAAPDAYGLRTHTKSSKQLTSYASAAIGNGHEPLSTNPWLNLTLTVILLFHIARNLFFL